MELKLLIATYLARREVYSLLRASRAMQHATDDRFQMLHRRLHITLTKPSLAKLITISRNEFLRTAVEEIGIIPSTYVPDPPSEAAVEKDLGQALRRFPRCNSVVATVPTSLHPSLDQPLVLACRYHITDHLFCLDEAMFGSVVNAVAKNA